ncbi:hypothetical protein CTI12_AA113150 [Artemisia annua]|uniref:Uncharacterized protein n=1 Tax=Artemisia annua TaxID=35608 RepID=A0A2U1PTK0_ARTAN|nr:hypothetical protein CTI12_AA113150 [Artemisia annua]
MEMDNEQQALTSRVVQTLRLFYYKIIALNEKSPKGFGLAKILDNIINKRGDKHILISKKVKLEPMGVMEEQK